MLSRYHIRRGTEADADADACYRIAIAQPRGTLPKLYRVHFADSARKNELHVAVSGRQVVGFARFHTRRDGWTTLYDLAVHPSYQGQGMGRNLLYSVPTPFRLKCPEASPANRFYGNCGLVAMDGAGGLNVYELRILTVFCMGGNTALPQLARASGMAYGVRSDYLAYDYPFMVDVPFKREDYSWKRHAKAVFTHRPVMALALDYEHPRQKAEILRQLQEFRNWGILRPTVCCKFDGAVADIPTDCAIAVSVPSRYEGFLPADLSEYAGRRLHLLGGTPQQWLDLIPKLRGVGAIAASVDGSSHETASKKGTHWQEGKWVNKGKAAAFHDTLVYSGRHIVRTVNEFALAKQASLFTVA